MDLNATKLRIIFSLLIIVGIITYGPGAAYSQEGDSNSNIQNLIVNGGFEGGFQEEFGIGYGWGGFSNGNAIAGWNFDDWGAVVIEGQYAQRIEIRDALELDRYAGIYQTISVVPGEQYKLTIKGLIRSSEGDITVSDYGYRLQYAVDYNGGVAWELVDEAEWKELPWDEQPLSEPSGGTYRQDSFETTITATGDTLTLFIRGWKKWLDNGSGIYDLDEISFVGPVPDGFQSPVAQEASVGAGEQESADEFVVAVPDAQDAENDVELPQETEAQAEDISETELSTESTESTSNETLAEPQTTIQSNSAAVPEPETAPLPVSGLGSDDSINYVAIVGVALLLILFVGAVLAAIRHRNVVE